MSYNYGLLPITANFNMPNNVFDIFSRMTLMSILHGEIAASRLIGCFKDKSNKISTFMNHKVCALILNIQTIIIIPNSSSKKL